MFKIDIQNANGCVAKLSGRLDTPSAIQAQKDMESLAQYADQEIVLDCSELEYISSSGLRLFLGLRKETVVKGGKVIIKNISDDIKNVFTMTGFFNLFEIR